MMSRYFPKLTAMLAVVFLAGCAPRIGDSCESSTECPAGATCDVTSPGGYCLIDGCDSVSCPDGSVCVEFDAEQTFCLEYCEANSDCRNGYVCRDDVGPAGFCYVAQ